MRQKTIPPSKLSFLELLKKHFSDTTGEKRALIDVCKVSKFPLHHKTFFYFSLLKSPRS